MLKHYQQERYRSCGAACFRILLSDIVDISESEARKECQTRASGTHTSNVVKALKNRGIPSNFVNLNVDFEEYSRWLFLNSFRRKLYLSCEYINRARGSKGGRDQHRHHAVIASNGFIFDPGENKPCPIEAYFDTYNKKLIIENMILIDIS